MQIARLAWVTLLGYGFMGTGLRTIAIPIPPAIAQAPDSCRQTNAITGIYEQPNLDSASRGVLANAETVRLELLGTGTGWARINQPVVGWVEARYLTPAVPCNTQVAAPVGSAQEERTTRAAQPDRTQEQPRLLPSRQPGLQQSAATTASTTETAATSTETSANSFPTPDRLPSSRPDDVAQITTLTCQVLPAYGLIVRSQPSLLGSTYLDTIPAGTHQFQFTRNTQTNETSEGIRRWVYIMAPVEGWISLGYIGKEFNLGGDCG